MEFQSQFRLEPPLTLPKIGQQISQIVSFLDQTFEPFEFGPDPIFAEWGPRLIDTSSPRITALLHPEFLTRWNGLMFEGAPFVDTIYFTCFPSIEALASIASQAAPRSLIFCHHALDYRSGSSEKLLGEGFVGWNLDTLEQLQGQGVSMYISHAPLDYNPTCGTTAALADALDMRPELRSPIIGEPGRTVGLIGDIEPITGVELRAKLSRIAGIERIDCYGEVKHTISRVAVVAGECTSIEAMKLVLDAGADVLIAGEIMSFASGSWGEQRRAEFETANIPNSLLLMAMSHGASESIVFERHLVPLLRKEFGVECYIIKESEWWR